MSSSPVSPLEQHLGYWLRFVSSHVSLAFSQKLAAHGVSAAEWVVLRLLLDRGAAAPSQLAAAMGMTRGALTKVIDRLATKGLIERSAAEGADRRFQRVALSPAGAGLVPLLAAEADRNDAEYFGHLTAGQQQELRALLEDLVRRHGLVSVPVS